MRSVYLWVHKKHPAVDNEVGFVRCDAKVGQKLLDAGVAQLPQVGAAHLKHIDRSAKEQKNALQAEAQTEAPAEAVEQTYETKVMIPEEPKRRGRPRKGEE